MATAIRITIDTLDAGDNHFTPYTLNVEALDEAGDPIGEVEIFGVGSALIGNSVPRLLRNLADYFRLGLIVIGDEDEALTIDLPNR